MGLLSRVSRWRRRRTILPTPQGEATTKSLRICRFEQVEERQLMAADIHLGVVYDDAASGGDATPNTFTVTWNGGAAGTELTQLVINLDKNGDGLTPGDCFFNTAPLVPGVYGFAPLNIVSSSGIQVTSQNPANGSQLLVLSFSGFTAGKTLVFTIDVDETGDAAPDNPDGANAIAEGAEFEGSILTGSFSAPHYYDVNQNATFLDHFDPQLQQSGLPLPNDNYIGGLIGGTTVNATPLPVHTAGGFFSAAQQALPVTLEGTVYYDPNLNNSQQAGEPGIANVSLTLYSFDGANYVSTGLTTTTDANGHYQFTNLAPGKYRIVETQPIGYFSVGASAGNVNGITDGVVITPDILSEIAVLGGEDVVHNDFSEALYNTISGKVRVDVGGDCETNPNAPPLSGVKVELLDQQGHVLQTAFTDADGDYSFGQLVAGTYTVREYTKTGYFEDDAHAGSAGGTVIDPTHIVSIGMSSGIDGIHYDFCQALPVSIAGRVIVDNFGNCETNPNNPPLAGVTIELRNQSGQVIATTTTDSEGAYKFQGLAPGTYTVHKITPVGYFDEDAHAGSAGGTVVDLNTVSTIMLGSGVDGANYDFCELLPVSIAGRVIVDNFGDCETNPNNPLLAGVAIQLLDQSGHVLQTTVTDANGAYRFQGLMPGTYTVHKLTPNGYFDEEAHAGSAGGTATDLSTITTIVLTSGTNGANYDFCEVLPVSISGQVRVDNTGDCEASGGNPPLAGVVVHLEDAGGHILATTTTDSQGNYAFQGMRPGTYVVHKDTPPGYFDEDDHVGSAGGTLIDVNTIGSISLTSGMNGLHYDFCEVAPVSISGYVKAEGNGDCQTDPNAPPLAGVTIQLLNHNGQIIGTTTTDGNGFYKFDKLPPAAYTVHELLLPGYFAGDDHVGSAGGVLVDAMTIGSVSLTSGMNGLHYDFCQVAPVTISGYVKVEVNGDCQTDPNAPPLAGVTIQLFNQNGGLVATTTTDVNGFYRFQGMPPGTYSVRKITPDGYFDADAHVGSAGGTLQDLDNLTNISLISGQMGIHYDFCEALPATISGVVKIENGKDCETDPTLPPLAGVTIQLLDDQGNVIGSTLTAGNGFYAFIGLRPGTYGVHELLPAGFFDAGVHVGSAGGAITGQDLITQITLTSGASGVRYDFCVDTPSVIAGYVFQDGGPIGTADPAKDLPFILQNLPSLRNGVLTPDDTRIAGVTLVLADAAGQVLLDSHGNPITTVTDASGFYQFAGLPPGIYTVLKVHPNGYIDGINTAGTLGGLAISPTLLGAGIASQGASASDALVQAVGLNDAIAMIVLSGGQLSLNNNFSEVILIQQDQIPVLNPEPNLLPTNFASIAPPGSPLLPPPLPPSAPPVIGPYLYGSWGANGTTWHLSVIDAGLPRGGRSMSNVQLHLTGNRFNRASWRNSKMTEGHWTLHPGHAPGGSAQNVAFGKLGGIPVSGDFNGDGVSEVGVFVDGEWFIDLNGNGVWDKDDLWAKLGSRNDRPVTGDWDGDGKTDIGIFGPAWPGDPRAVASEPGLPDPYNSQTGVPKNVPPKRNEATLGWRTMKRSEDGEVRADLIDHVFHFGTPDDIPVTGDWTGAGIDAIGIFSKGRWILDVDGDGKRSEKDIDVNLGQPGDKPVVGDFDGDGVDELGVYRDGDWHVDINHDGVLDDQDLHYQLGDAGHRPVVGDWDGDGCDQIGIHQERSSAGGSL